MQGESMLKDNRGKDEQHGYGLNACVTYNSPVEALIPSLALFGDGASKEVVKVKWGHKIGSPDLMGFVTT